MLSMTIPARVYSADCAKYAEFNATGWFATAPMERILELARTGWSGALAVNEVARYEQNANDEVAEVFQYVMYLRHGGRESACKCFIDSVSALEWLAYHRPDVLAAIRMRDVA